MKLPYEYFFERIVQKKYRSASINKKGAHLIFTTHGTSILKGGLLRRDQIWFIKKHQNGSSNLYPLSDYKLRKKETIADGYLIGRYDAVPIVPQLFDFE